MTSRIARALFDRPRCAWLVLLVLLGASAALAPRLRPAAGVDVYVDRARPLQALVDDVAKHFVNDDLLFVVYTAKDVFSHESLRAVRRLGDTLQRIRVSGADRRPIAAIDDVKSLTTVDDLVGSSTSFRASALVPNPLPSARPALERIARRARNNPIIRQSLLGRRRGAAAISLRLAPQLDAQQRAAVVAAVRDRVARASPAGAFDRLEVIGAAAIDADLAAYQQRDLRRFTPIVFVVLLGLVLLFAGTLRAVAFCAVVVLGCLAVGMAALQIVGGTVNNTSAMIPPLMLALSMAMLLHYLSEYGKYSADPTIGDPRIHTLARLLPPVLLAAVTTAIGFGALAVSRIPAVHQFGLAAALGLMLAFVTATAAISLLLRRVSASKVVSPRALALSPGSARLFDRLAELVTNRPLSILVIGAVFVGLMAVGIGRVVVDQNGLAFFSKSAPIRRANALMEQQIGGSTVVVLSIEGSRDGQFLEPSELKKVAALRRWLEQETAVDQTISVVDFLELMHREFFAGDPAQLRLPRTADQAAQLLLMNGDPAVDETIDPLRRRLRIVGRTTDHSAAKLVALYQRIDRYLARAFPAAAGYRAFAAAKSRQMASMVDDLISSQLASIGLSCVLIFGLIFIVLRSPWLGLCSLIPNALPIVTGLGLMGWLGIELSAATVMISTAALGIAVDDTLHLLQCLKRQLRDSSVPQAIRVALRIKGPAIVGTSVVISLSFSVLLLADFRPTRQFALLMAVVLLVAMVADLVLLPAALIALRRLVERAKLSTSPTGVADAKDEPDLGAEHLLAAPARAGRRRTERSAADAAQ